MSTLLTPRVPASRILISFLLVSLIAGAPACDDEDPGPSVPNHDAEREVPTPDPTHGTIVFHQMEGGFHAIIGDDGAHWDPVNLPDTLAIDSLRVSFQGEPRDLGSAHMWGQPMELVEIRKIGDPPPINLEPFRELARNASCADVRNRLFLIDRQLVFWDRQSRCADATYNYTLYGRTPMHRLCSREDSIAGPRGWCVSAGRYADIFALIARNLDQPDLGLGPGRVEPVDF